MIRVLTIGVAAYLASIGVAGAGTKPVTINFDGSCDGLILTPNVATRIYGSNHIFSCPGKPGNPIPGIGIVVKHGPSYPDRMIAVSDSNLDSQGFFVTYFIQIPLASGNPWVAYVTTDGATVTESGKGTYSVAGTPHQGAKGDTSTLDKMTAVQR
jgi:hypothetical protein